MARLSRFTAIMLAGTAAVAAIAVGGGIAVGGPATLGAFSSASAPAAFGESAPASQVTRGICTTPATHAGLAARLSRDILAAARSRRDTVSATMADRRTGVVCRLAEGHRFDSASVVKATILAALQRWHAEQHTALTKHEITLATSMITASDNNAASALWAEVGHARMQHFLNLARMTETILGPGGYWGLTQITARDELTLLRLLTKSNAVLSDASRSFELGLMARVIPSQRWGVPAGAPKGVTVHVKNGWLPRATRGWRVHSIGAFNGDGRDYMIAVLTDNNPTMAYGVATIQAIARVMHRDLNAGLASAGVVEPAPVTPAQEVPDENIPALPSVP